MFAIDITEFGSRDDHHVQLHLRETMYRIVDEAAAAAGVPWTLCHREDRGDGFLALAPAWLGAETLVDPLTVYLWAGLRRHNRLAGEAAKIRMRAAVHAGYVRLDANGATGNALNLLFRLLDCPQLKDALNQSDSDFGLIASDYLYDEVIRHGMGVIDPHRFRPVEVDHKETMTRAWLWLPCSSPPAPTPARPHPPTPPPPLNLTRDEVDVAFLVAAGRTQEEITLETGLAHEVVEQAVRQVRAELQFTSTRPHAVSTAWADYFTS